MSPERVPMLGADGRPLGWTYDAEQYELVAARVLATVDAAGADVLLKEVVAAVQEALGSHPAFPSGRMTNAARYVAADLVGRGVLERVEAAGPRRLRRVADGAAAPPGA